MCVCVCVCMCVLGLGELLSPLMQKEQTEEVNLEDNEALIPVAHFQKVSSSGELL